ncbi:TolC family protein [Galenea microaerophila]
MKIQGMIGLLAWTLTGWTQAAENTLPQVLLHLQQQAIQHAPSMQAQWLQVVQAKQKVALVKSLRKPKVRFKSELSYAWMEQDFARTANQLEVSYPLYAPDLKLGEQEAQTAQQLERWQALASQRQLKKQVGLALIQLLKQQEQVRYAQRQLQAMNQILKQLQGRYQLGMIQLNDIADVQSRIALMQAKKLLAQQQVQELWQKLSSLSGLSVKQLLKMPLPLADQKRIEQTVQTLKRWQKRCQNPQSCVPESAILQHPLLQALQQKQQQFRQQAQKVKARYGMKLQAVGSYIYNDSGQHFYDDMQGAKAALQLTVPLYLSGEEDSAVSEVRAKQLQSQWQWQQQRRNLQSQAQIAAQGLQFLAKQLPVFQSALQASEQALKATQAGLKTGERNILDVLNAQRDVDLMRKTRNTALYEVWRYQVLWQFVLSNDKNESF